MRWWEAVWQKLGRPPNDDETQARLREHQREQAEEAQRLEALEAEVRALTRDSDWHPRPRNERRAG